MLRPITLLVCVAAACTHGVRPQDFEPATGPQGVAVAIRVTGEQADRLGELIAVDSVGLLLGTGSVVGGARSSTGAPTGFAVPAPPTHIVRIAWARVGAMDVYRLGSEFDIPLGERVAPDKRARLALVARFPQGLDGDLLAAVLAAIKQEALEEIK